MTQVVTPEPGGALTHNRLTHSLKVAQVARSIAERLLGDASTHGTLAALGGLDADVAEAAGLAHDIGHPPFGHVGETVLDQFARRTLRLQEGFEGNAQSFRIVARLDSRSVAYEGMDLTAATLCAVLKYPWARARRRGEDLDKKKTEAAHLEALMSDPEYALKWQKFSYYAEEQEDFEFARSIGGVTNELQSVEAAIMDLADDVTYALHDLQDFYLARVLPVSVVVAQLDAYLKHTQSRSSGGSESSDAAAFAAVARKLATSYPTRFDHDEFTNAVKTVLGDVRMSFLDYFDASPDAAASVNRFVSRKLGELTQDLKVNPDPTGETPAVHLAASHWHEVQVLKQLTSMQVIGRPDMAVYQRAQQGILVDLLDAMHEWAGDAGDAKRLPQPLLTWRDRASDEGRSDARCLVDFVSSLSDHQALGLHRALKGNGQGLTNALVF